MPKEIEVHPELCCGCLLCTLICSALHYNVFWPSKAYITVKRDIHDAHFTLSVDERCETCFACVKVCPTGSLLQEGENG